MGSFLKTKYLLIFVLLLGLSLRLYSLNWDQSQHFQPDEREITLVTLQIHWPTTQQEWQALFTPQSPLNPKFFAYGSLPIYLLKALSVGAAILSPLFASYEMVNLLGRFLSALFDTGTILLLYLLGKRLFSEKTGLIASALYAVAVLPIQLSHFYAVDTLLTFFITLTLYQLISYLKQPTNLKAALLGLCFGLAMATKVSALPLGLIIALVFIWNILTNPKTFSNFWKSFAIPAFLVAFWVVLIFIITNPYALIDFSNFRDQLLQQQMMTKDAFTFPYTLQYVGITPYWYELKNIFFWGLGPLLGALSLVGVVLVTILSLKNLRQKPPNNLILLGFFYVYFGVVGSFAIGFMRYMLPVYPLLVLFAAYFSLNIGQVIKSKTVNLFLAIILGFLILIWPVSFMEIYRQPNTRNQATDWILTHIPAGETIAVEHWDDELPVGKASEYNVLTLPLYDPDTPQKWANINQSLSQTDYIIIASKRLYVPLQKLTDCAKLPTNFCYAQTANYYQQLFNGKLGFQEVSQWTDYPKIPILNWTINDSSADESFTVYDHPKVMIFTRSP